MRKLLLAVLPAFLLTACAASTRSTLSYSPAIPPSASRGEEALHGNADAPAAGR